MPATPATIDPLKAFIAGASAGAGHPIPLISTRFDVEIDGGLATVVTKRVFRNKEAQSIEATITFPVPVHAVLFDLEARIDGRVVKASAQRRTKARESYEDAIERGKAAVLHEEVLRGVHMLSVGHLGPGKEIEVTSRWTAALTFVGDRGELRIPLTVGDIYGRSGLPDSDDLLTGGPVQDADLFIRCRNGVVAVRGARLEDGHTRVALNAPIDLMVTQAVSEELRGVAADGREVVLRISPHRGGDNALNVAIVVDRSGSMDMRCSDRTSHTKHGAVVTSLKATARRLGDEDTVDLWEFDHQPAHVGSSRGGKRGLQQLLSLIAHLNHPGGGTEIGTALSSTMAGSGARDILLITDGRSHALDVHELARKGRRITVVLVGQDSLEANVGHLAALSGGDIFVAAGDSIADALSAAIESLRTPSERSGSIGSSLDRIRVVRGNAVLEAEWRPAAGPSSGAAPNRSAAAMAASLALPVLDAERAALLAEAEGLVTHLTSLVLVDEEGEVHEGIPAMRKIALPAPSMAAADSAVMSNELRVLASRALPQREARYSMSYDAGRRLPPMPGRAIAQLRIDWDASPNQLLAGDLSELDPQDALLIAQAAALPEVVALAQRINVPPTVLVVALIAHFQASGNRSAARMAKAILGDQFTAEMVTIAALLGLR